MNENKINLLNEELDDESAKYITEHISEWKENVFHTLSEEVETAKEEKLRELEEKNFEYREELKEEYSEKLVEAIAVMEESIRAEVTASILKNNPEIKILEQIKEIIAPTLSEDYRSNAYSETIEQLAEENETLKRNAEIMEGAEELSSLLAPYDANTQNLVLSLVKPGSPEEIREQFVDIISSLEEAADEADKKAKDEDDDDEDKTEDETDEDSEDSEDDEDEEVEESFIDEGFYGEDFESEELDEEFGSMKNMIKSYI